MITVGSNGHSNQNLLLEQNCLHSHSANPLEKSMNSTILPPVMGKQ